MTTRLPHRQVSFSQETAQRKRELFQREWLITSGNGGYASGTLAFVPTRRHHGLLIANLPAPRGRTLLLSQLREEVRTQSSHHPIALWGIQKRNEKPAVHAASVLDSFQLVGGIPTWGFRIGEGTLFKSIVMPQGGHRTVLRYEWQGGEPLSLQLRPMIQFRGHNDSVSADVAKVSRVVSECVHQFTEMDGELFLQIRIEGTVCDWTEDAFNDPDCWYAVEQARGYNHVGDLSSPGFWEATLQPAEAVVLTASAMAGETAVPDNDPQPFRVERERREELLEIAGLADQTGVQAELVLAADQFLIQPAPRDADESADAARRRSIIAGYPWFTDWGRDTMISLPGLTLATGRYEDAKRILLTFADYVRDGLIPNLFPEGGQEGMYHTADATLWFFQALAEYRRYTQDDELVRGLLPKLNEIIQAHLEGTHYGIGVDHSDGLLVQGADNVQLTWMDAKAGDWVVTPRRGKAVEICALWHNALTHFVDWTNQFDDLSNQVDRPALEKLAAQGYENFNQRFWNQSTSCLRDLVDSPDDNEDAIRPNQLFAISLDHPVLQKRRWASVVGVCRDQLLTPVGLRSLAPSNDAYLGEYHGDVYARDAAYHQGTVWSWLIGPMIKAWCKAHPERTDVAADWLNGLQEHLGEACIGQISEIFTGDAPHEPKGCFAQAWSVAELLLARQLVNDS